MGKEKLGINCEYVSGESLCLLRNEHSCWPESAIHNSVGKKNTKDP